MKSTKNTKYWMAVLTAIGTLNATYAEEAKVSASAEAAALSAYNFRGQIINDEMVVQPAMTVSKAGFSINVWNVMNMTDRMSDEGEFTETDITLSYALPSDKVTLSGGVIQYLFPNQTLITTDMDGNESAEAFPGTRELFVALGLPVLLTPTLAVYYDVDAANGVYGNFSLSHTQKLCEKTSVTLAAGLGAGDGGYNGWYYGVEEDALNDASVTASATIALTGSLTLTPMVQYVWLPDSMIEAGAEGLYKDTEMLIGGAKLAYTF